MTELHDIKRVLGTWVPPLAGVLLIAGFLSLASWQLDRAAEKEAAAALFDEEAPPATFDPGGEYRHYQPVSASGRYVADRQFLIDNIVRNSQLGFYVITPLEMAGSAPLLLVNRGWLPRPANGATPEIAVATGQRQVTGRIGRLPRVALRPDAAIEPGQEWPRVAVYPTLDDIAASLRRPLAGAVLLLAPDADDGYLREWRPQQRGPMMHYGYAFQWSALAVTVFVILVWQLRKRYRRG